MGQLIPFDELLETRERRRIAPDWNTSTVDVLAEAFDYFCRTYWHVRHPERGCIPFEMSDAQRETARAWIENRYTIILKARQLGFSTLAGAFTVWATYFYEDRHIIMLSKTERDAIKLLDKCKYGFKKLPQWMLLTGPVWDSKQTMLAFGHDSKIESLPSGNDPARGESVWMLVLDEWAFLPNPEEAWASVEATTDIGGRVIGLSTANGEGNIFHDKWVGSTGTWTDRDGRTAPTGNSSNEFKSIFYGWWHDGAGQRDDEWHENKSRNTADWQMAQEYPSSPEEAFLRSGRPYFNVDSLLAIELVEPKRGHVAVDAAGWTEFRQDGGPLRLWEPPRERGRYVIGCDVSEGLDHGDFTSIHVLDARNRKLVAHWHGKIDPDLLGTDLLPQLGRWYGTALVGVESNNHGLTTLKALQRAKYPNIYYDRTQGTRQDKPTSRMGFRTTKSSKPLVIDGLNEVIRDQTLEFGCGETVQELKTFVREGDGKLHGSPWDDRTMSFAIAVHMLQFAFLAEFVVETEPGPGTMGYFEKYVYGLEKPAVADAVGAHSYRRSA